MLGKLIKYDLKSSGKLFLLLHGIFLIFCVLMRFIYMNRLDLIEPVDEKMLVVSLLLFFTLFTVFVSALMFYTRCRSRSATTATCSAGKDTSPGRFRYPASSICGQRSYPAASLWLRTP